MLLEPKEEEEHTRLGSVQAAGGWPGSPAVGDNSSRAMQRLKDMYARNTPMHEQDRPPQPQGVKQLLQVNYPLSCPSVFPVL